MSTIASARADNVTYVPLSDTILDVYSREIEFVAQPVLRFEQFAVKKTDLSVAPGLKIQMLTYNNLTAGGQLTEGVAMSTQALSTSMKDIEVYEFGNAIAVTELLLQASFDSVMSSAAKLLGKDYAIVLDTLLRDTVLGGSQVVMPNKKVDDTTLLESDTFNSAVVKDAVEILATQNAPKFNGDFYVCFIHPHQARGIRDDAEFQNVTAYGKQYAGEIGRIHDVVFIETTQVRISPVAGQSFNKYEAVMIGENAYGLAIALPVEMRDGGIEDFGRVHKLAWYSIMGAGILHDENIVRIETR